MRRLTYAPKAYVFIRSSNMNGKVYDLSDDVVSGTVTRNMNQPSTASFQVNNRFFKYQADPTTHRQIFLPMDMVTIWLQRIAGQPIQVFTGYLDSVPMRQLYPGVAQFTATCVLKRLGYQYFDPGLDFFHTFLESLGWFIDPATGNAQQFDHRLHMSNPNANPNKRSPVNDGGFAQLLYEFMVQIAGWKEDNIFVSNLPTHLSKRAAKLYDDINNNTEGDLKILEQMMGQVMGINYSPNNGVKPDGTLSTGVENTISKIRKSADRYNIPLDVLLSAGLVLSGFNPNFDENISDDPNGWGTGLFAARIQTDPKKGTVHKIHGYTLEELKNPANAADAFCRDLVAADVVRTGFEPRHGGGKYSPGARQGNGETIRKWIGAASGREIDPSQLTQNFATATQWTKTWNSEHNTHYSTKNNQIGKTITHLDWSSPEITKLFQGTERAVYQSQYKGKILKELAPYYFYLKKNAGNCRLSHVKNQHHEDLWMTFDNQSAAQAALKDLQVKERQYSNQIDAVELSGHHNLRITTHAGADYPEWDTQIPVRVTQDTKNPEPTSSIAKDGLTFQQLGTFSLDSAFAAQFAFPSDIVTSRALTGEKALMNDMSCLEAVEQLCAASLRSFMSTPDGRFVAFYPDYFGANGRGPYMYIHDIEITNLGVQLNDESLATHVYVIGDVFGNDDQIDVWDKVGSRGVVTIAQAMILDMLITPDHEWERKAKQQTDYGRLKDGFEFLQHFGARVYKEEQPLIKNAFYEFLYALQRFMQKWTECFATIAEFTFHPDVFAGGVIGFPQHNLQMYVQSVTHNWDYASGFTTSATLSSPAAINNNGAGVGALPGFALAGNVLSIGTGPS